MSKDYKQFIRDAFEQIISSTEVNEQVIAHFFHPGYRQYVDGVELDYTGFIQHMKAQKNIIAEVSTFFTNIVSEGDTVFTNHEVSVRKFDGGDIKIHVIAEFNFKDGKIIRCDELTRMLSGLPEDRNIGSRV